MERREFLISVIVPLYRGRKYMEKMTAQIEACAACLGNGRIELVYSNDDPDEQPEFPEKSPVISVRFLETDQNRGIHGARVRGLENSSGDYVLFLDQDDQIVPDYFVSQLQAIGSGDAVICNAVSGGRLKYDTDRPLSDAASRACMVRKGNQILSPGQVLLRRSAIPACWLRRLLSHNGADDWLLWLCMHEEGKRFAVNPDVLFIREVHYHNASLDCGKMALSEQEVYRVTEENHLLTAGERKDLAALLPVLQEQRIRENEKWKRMFLLLYDWFSLEQRGLSLAGYFRKRGIRFLAIYGYGYLGRMAVKHLTAAGDADAVGREVEAVCIIDKNAAFLWAERPCYTPEDALPAVDGVLLTVMTGEAGALAEQIRQRLQAPVFYLETVIGEMAAESACSDITGERRS